MLPDPISSTFVRDAVQPVNQRNQPAPGYSVAVWLLDRNQTVFWCGGFDSVQRLQSLATTFVGENPAAAPLVATSIPDRVLCHARFALAVESSSLMCRLF